MNPSKDLGGKVPAKGEPSTAASVLGLRQLVRRTLLLNLGIIVSGMITAVYLGRPEGFVVIFALLAIVSVVVWSLAFAFRSFAILFQIFTNPLSLPVSRPFQDHAPGSGVADRWLDEPA